MMMQVGIVGCTGYTGLELCRLLIEHKQAEIVALYGNRSSGCRFSDLHPQFQGLLDLEVHPFDPEQIVGIDCLFLAVPHGQSHAYMKKLVGKGFKIIDLSADFRLRDAQVYASYYGIKHGSPELLEQFVLGYPELHKEELRQADYCANPGCYSTSVNLALYPLAQEKLIQGKVIVDAKSGVSGAGRSLKEELLFCEVNENFSAYATGEHRHEAEIKELLGCEVLFSPHLVPQSRGILSTIYIQLSKEFSEEKIKALYQEYYKNKPFVLLEQSGKNPSTKYVVGSNQCMLFIKVIDKKSVVIFSALDNLLKGAAGQAVQNMNLMFGFFEEEGLPRIVAGV